MKRMMMREVAMMRVWERIVVMSECGKRGRRA